MARRSHNGVTSKELVPPSHYRERTTTKSTGPSQSSRDREMDCLRVQVLALQ